MRKATNKWLFAALLLLCAATSSARERQCFDDNWLFILADSVQMATPEYDDNSWRHLDLPHDWAIEGDFLPSNPSGASGGALPGGVGWYRKHFTVGNEDKYFIEFDGVYMNAAVYLNGHLLGQRPYGYSSFEYDLTPYLNRGGDNVMAVRVDNSDQPNSRWYSGCGVYRHVWLTST
ncbi:MAG: beta galactosidase jelly roll domain-containing protein, partial [Prevotella sp.]|nr:beta galactosidase jelly roll domain-containing protein [Prevotella sp.]